MAEQQGDWTIFDSKEEAEELKEAIAETLGKDKKECVLTKDQESFVLENWQNMGLLALTRRTFDDKTLNGRSPEAKAIQKFLGARKVKKKGGPELLSLTDSQKEFVRASIDSLNPYEIAKIIFDKPKLEGNEPEVFVVSQYAKTLGDVEKFPHEPYPAGEYRAPDQLSAVVTKVNKYLRKDLSLKTMPHVQRKIVEVVRDFLHAPRFLQAINSYISEKTREMFEGEFVRSVFDKPDLTPDELNMVITLCQHYVSDITLRRQIDMLNIKYEEVLNDSDQKLTVPLAQMVKEKSDELTKCTKARNEIVKFLSGERSRRQDKHGGNQASIANLIEWFKNEEERVKALKVAELHASEDEEEVDRIETIPEMKARVLGLSRSELLNG